MAIPKIILDTDIGGDCDDAGALALLQEANRKGNARLLAVTLSTPRPYTAGCTDAINRWYGNVVPIGQTSVCPPGDDGKDYKRSYGKAVAERYPNAYGNTPPKDDAVRVLRRVLSEQADGGITIVVIGYFTNIARLLESQPDDISSLDGKTLFDKRVEKLVVAAGDFSKPEAECNIAVDIEAARFVLSNCNKPIVFCTAEAGRQVMTGKPLIDRGDGNPVAFAYDFCVHGDRYSWDPITAFYAVFGTEDILSLTPSGIVSVNEVGISTFREAENGLHRLICVQDSEKAKRRIDQAMLGVNHTV
jgi:inosine-uridine nucleoside N-ribohydrolase